MHIEDIDDPALNYAVNPTAFSSCPAANNGFPSTYVSKQITHCQSDIRDDQIV